MAYTESGANINATWQTCDQIMVVADGQVSTLTLTDGAGSSSATFVGTISHTNPLTATTPLLCYVKDQNNPSAVTVNADGTYTYTSGAFLSQDGTMASAAKCNLYYGMAQYGDGSNISCDFSVNTSMMKFAVDASGLTEGEATLSYKSGDATINLRGTNTVQASHDYYPGIFIPSLSTLCIGGSGRLTAIGGNASAGIGSGYMGSCGNITIDGGTVTATGGKYSAGIGCSFSVPSDNSNENSCGTIYITGGAITATGGEHGAGIGSGRGSSFNGIDISNGIQYVTATSGSNDAKPIGAGEGDTNNSPVNFSTVNVAEMTVEDGDKFGDIQGYLTIAVSTDADGRAVWTLTPLP